MFETPITVVGNIVNDPHGRRVGDQEVIKFRVAKQPRRRTADAPGRRGNSLFVTVNCWAGCHWSRCGFAQGRPVIVVGHVYTAIRGSRRNAARRGDACHIRWAGSVAVIVRIMEDWWQDARVGGRALVESNPTRRYPTTKSCGRRPGRRREAAASVA